MTAPSIAVVGSVNLDMVARAPRLPVPGETVTDAQLDFFPGGKGANQALAARRLGAEVSLYAAVGNDSFAEQALALLREDGVDLAAFDIGAKGIKSEGAGHGRGLFLLSSGDRPGGTVTV